MRTFKIGFVEFLSQDIKKMRFRDAVKYCESLGEGWRLPTFQEMDHLFMDLNRLGVGGFKNEMEESGGYFIHPYYWVGETESGRFISLTIVSMIRIFA